MNTRLLALGALCLASTSACAVDAVSSSEAYDTETCPACAEADYHVQIITAPGLAADLSLVYQSRSDSWGCTDLVWDMLNPKRIPEQYRQDLTALQCARDADGRQVCDFAFSDARGDGCDSTIQHIYLVPTDEARAAEPWASLSLTEREEYANDVQRVECTATNGVINCGNDLLDHTATGRARIELVWSGDAPY